MFRYGFFIFAIFLLVIAGGARAFPLNALLVTQKQVIHLSGGTTSAPAPAAPAPGSASPQAAPPATTAVPSLTTTVPATSTPSSSSSGSVPVPAARPSSGRSVQSSSTARLGSGRTAGRGGEGSADKVRAPEDTRKVRVENGSGKEFVMARMTSGIENELRLDTAAGKVHVRFADLESIRFLEKHLGKVVVRVKFVSGNELEGTVYDRTVFEFSDADKVVTARAEELGSVNFMKE